VDGCGLTAPNAGVLGAHLQQDHAWPADEALSTARELYMAAIEPAEETPPTPAPIPPDASKEEPSMPCTRCGKTGHNASSCGRHEKANKTEKSTAPARRTAEPSGASPDGATNLRAAIATLRAEAQAKLDAADHLEKAATILEEVTKA
jgi:hypothetical protein